MDVFTDKLNFYSFLVIFSPHHSGFYLIGLCDDRRGFSQRAIQVLDALLVIVAQLQGIGEAVIRGHHCTRFPGVLQAQNMPKLMSSHLEEVCACSGIRERVTPTGIHSTTTELTTTS